MTIKATTKLLPDGYEALEPYVAKWAKDSSAERMTERATSSMEDIQAFYDAILPLADEAMNLIDNYPIDDMPEDIACLCKLVLALPQVAMAVELHGQPRLPNTPYPHGIELLRGTPPFG